MAQDKYCVVDPSWELIDPNPDIHLLFNQFNEMFFWGTLSSVYVVWSPRMTLCAGMCRYHPRNRECSIHMSKPLLSYRPRKDLVETLLHEMIHAYLFIADGDRERESHGPKFHEHMFRINHLTGANITVYHSFHDEVNHFKTHWWKCSGPCQHRPPYYGIVKRSMNRAPGPNDFWYKEHQQNCGGQFTKIKEPSPKKAAKKKKEDRKHPGVDENKSKNKITSYFTPNKSDLQSQSVPGHLASATATSAASIPSAFPSMAKSPNQVQPFTGRGNLLGSIENNPPKVSSTARNLFDSAGTASRNGNVHSIPVAAATSQSASAVSGEQGLASPVLKTATGQRLGGGSTVGEGVRLGGGSTDGGGIRLGGGSTVGGGIRLGGGSALMRRGEHPLLSKLASQQGQSSSNMADAPRPNLHPPKRNRSTEQTSKASSSTPASHLSVAKKPKIEIVELD